jgi:hypothetical protein
MKLSRLADWITIATWPLTVFATFLGWKASMTGTRTTTGLTMLQNAALTLILTAAVWFFCFFSTLRVSVRYARRHEDLAGFVFYILASLLGCFLFIGFELLLMDALAWPEETVAAWLGAFAVLWVLSAFLGYLLVSIHAAQAEPDM